MNVLVLNAGSSSLKYRLLGSDLEQVLHQGVMERIGGPAVPSHHVAIQMLLSELPSAEIRAVGHRVVHGGEHFREACLIGPAELPALDAMTPLAPLHNPPALAGIRAALELLPGVPNVAVFDTAFHASLPPEAYLYALPYALYQEHGVRRYGFHGTSHAYVSREAARCLGRAPDELRLVSLHLGNGASACAVLQGRSVDTSMGFTPLEGLVMGTRSGSLDPAIALWLAGREGVQRAGELLNRASGLLGLSGLSGDVRDLHRARQEGDARAELALRIMVYRVCQQVGAYVATLGGIDALIFTGGVGENDPWTRAEVLRGLGAFGFRLDEAANRRGEQCVSVGSPRALVIPTDEEGEIARQTLACLHAARGS